MIVHCINTGCPEFEVDKDNPSDFPVEEISCGKCGQPVAEHVTAREDES
jgi:hypothetical protein